MAETDSEANNLTSDSKEGPMMLAEPITERTQERMNVCSTAHTRKKRASPNQQVGSYLTNALNLVVLISPWDTLS